MLAICLAASAGAACAGDDGADQASELDPDSLWLRAEEVDTSVLSELPVAPEDEASSSDDGASAQPKIREGTLIDYDDQIGNSTVRLERGIDDHCTGQVINKWWILTAAHCVPHTSPANMKVEFVKRDGNYKTVYNGSVLSAKVPDWTSPFLPEGDPNRAHTRDIGMIFLSNGMTTCSKTLAWCAANQPDMPVNAAFQYYDQNNFKTLLAYYAQLGHGSVDGYYSRRLRYAFTMIDYWYKNTGTPGYLVAQTRWNDDSMPRTCKGDSGGPLMMLGTALYAPRPADGRSFFTGILSGGNACTDEEGVSLYSVLDMPRAAWVVGNLGAFSQFLGLNYACTVPINLPAGYYGFQCGN